MFDLAKIQQIFNEVTLTILVSLSAFTLWRHFGLATVAGAVLVWSIVHVVFLTAKNKQAANGATKRAELETGAAEQWQEH